MTTPSQTPSPTITEEHVRALETTSDGLLVLHGDTIAVLERGDAEPVLAEPNGSLVTTPQALRPLLASVDGDREEAARRLTWELKRMLAEGDSASTRPAES